MRKKAPIDALLPATRRAILAAVTQRADQWKAIGSSQLPAGAMFTESERGL